MKWEEYINLILKDEKCLDNIKLELDGKETEIPAIVKASVFMLEKMIKHQGKYNLFVFPDGNQIPFVFMLSKLIYNIFSGKIEQTYNPEDFLPGQKLRLGNAIVEFEKVDYEKAYQGEKAIYIKNADCTRILRVEYAPFFQTTDSEKRLSSDKTFEKERNIIAEEINAHNNFLGQMMDMKTHMNGSIFYVASVSRSKKQANEYTIDGNHIYDYILVGNTDYTGKIETLKGKYTGIPSLVFASQMSYVNEAIREGAKCQSVIINLNECDIETQLDSLDELKTFGVPVVFVSDTINSFEISHVVDRGFNVWRWDRDCITNTLITENGCNAEKKINNCLNEDTTYYEVKSPDIDNTFLLLYKYRRAIEEESERLNSLYNALFEMAYYSLRNVCELSDAQRNNYLSILDKCEEALGKEACFISEEMNCDFKKIIDIFRYIYSEDYVFPKNKKIIELLKKSNLVSTTVICSNRDNPQIIKNELTKELDRKKVSCEFDVVTVKEAIKDPNLFLNNVIITGWFSSSSVRSVLYGYKSKVISVLLYGCEKKWKNAHVKNWKNCLNNENNKTIVNSSFVVGRRKKIDIQIETKNRITKEEKIILKDNEDLEYVLQENKYRKYVYRGKGQGEEIVEAKPVSYVGGQFSLFRKGHNILSVTKIIYQIAKKIEEKDVDKLVIGDFVVIRETSKNLVKEVADMILKKNGLIEKRKVVEIWQEALKIESSLSSVEEIRDKLKEVGCDRNIQTIRNWIYNDEIIIPMNKNDLYSIAEITQDSVLLERIEEVYDAGKTIQSAHIKAGHILSERLNNSIVSKINDEKITDPYNIWDPIELNIKDVGIVKILKVTDIGQNWIQVSVSDTNKILSEDKGEELWQ